MAITSGIGGCDVCVSLCQQKMVAFMICDRTSQQRMQKQAIFSSEVTHPKDLGLRIQMCVGVADIYACTFLLNYMKTAQLLAGKSTHCCPFGQRH